MSKFLEIAEQLACEKPLDPKYKNHKLSGNFKGRWECHVEPDWLLIYYLTDDRIVFERTGSHSDLFK
jgi:mRNA interferase YafQ